MSEGQRKKAIPIPVKRECASSVTFPALKKAKSKQTQQQFSSAHFS